MIKFDKDELADICREYGVEYLGLFGSVARGEDGPGSDVDLLVRFGQDGVKGMVGMMRMQYKLEDLLGRKVDLVTEGFLSKYFRNRVIAESKQLYARG